MSKHTDLTGRTFGRLTVTSRANVESNRCYWNCECNCGNKVVVRTDNLTGGKSNSCGCLQKESTQMHKKLPKKLNTYNLSGDFCIGYTSNGKEFYFDLEDYDKIKDYCWHIDNHGYVRTILENRKSLHMHKLIISSFRVDHIHGKESRNDNRKSNLRECTISQNAMNKDIRNDNTSGITGVSWYSKYNKWMAYICINGKQKTIGYFVKIEDAIKARKEAEEKYFGEFSYDNSMKVGVCNG